MAAGGSRTRDDTPRRIGKTVRGTGFRRASDAAGPNLRSAAARRGMAELALIRDWPGIVGAEIASLCRPVRVARRGRGDGATAALVVAAPGAAVPEVTHLAGDIAERVNRVYGYRAIERVQVQRDTDIDTAAQPHTATALLAEPAAPYAADAPPPPPSPALAAIADPDLRAALARLETNIKRKAARPGGPDRPLSRT